ncbi:MAG TPA: RNA 2',3'-cyclic phosphodiesterase [Solirubrobacteraceae bacterium]|nr:RNA 2',3'-cyclic phosphodiesterase [Solirubrobacteraceae bacterium]
MSARLFVALELPADVRAALATFGRAAAENDRALRPSRHDALHLTLAFLGHRALDEVEPARAVVRGLAGSPAPVLTLGDALWLAPRRPHVLTVQLEDAGGVLGALQATMVERLAGALPWQPEARPFRAHVTVARVRREWRPRVDELPEAPRATFTAGAVVLFRSHLGGGPVRYEPLERAELGARTTSSSWPPP